MRLANASRLTGKLLALKDYNGLRVYAEYFDAAMDRLRGQAYLDKPLESISHPASLSAPAQQATVAPAGRSERGSRGRRRGVDGSGVV